MDSAQLQALVGATGPAQVARHPVSTTGIADWCDAMGLRNPRYAGPDAVAPIEMLDVWDRPGLGGKRNPESPRTQVIQLLEAEGFTSVVGVNSEIEAVRYVKPGELLQNVEILDAVSEEKTTGLGTGYFVTTRHRYTTADGQHVGDLLFRILKFKPRAGGGPNPDPSLRPRPAINLDNRFFWEGAREHELRIQRCDACSRLISPPTVRCPDCGSMELGYTVASGRGTLYSWAAPHYPQANGFRYPVLVGLVELEEGTRLVSNLVGVTRDEMQIGMPLEVTWLDSHPPLADGMWDSRGSISLPQFQPVRYQPPQQPARDDATTTGTAIAPLDIEITPTLIISGALASRDFTPVHHDRDVAVAAGSKDLFMNINTTMGLVGRYVSDFAPDRRIAAIRVKLGVPNYPGDLMTLTGTYADDVVTVQGRNSLGNHVTGTVELAP